MSHVTANKSRVNPERIFTELSKVERQIAVGLQYITNGEKRLAAAIVEGLTDLLNGLRAPDSEVHRKFREALSETIEELVNSSEHRAKLNEAKNRMPRHPDGHRWMAMTHEGPALDPPSDFPRLVAWMHQSRV
jgi:hypothetical protein